MMPRKSSKNQRRILDKKFCCGGMDFNSFSSDIQCLTKIGAFLDEESFLRNDESQSGIFLSP
jgi:hypothetical protein